MKNTTIDKLSENFAKVLLSKMEQLDSNWEKPWFTNSVNSLPVNITGYSYNGGNLMMLMFLQEIKKYELPIYLTFKQAENFNIRITKGEESFPIMHYLKFAVDKDGTIISEPDYSKLSEQEKENYTLKGRLSYSNVFNISQTDYLTSRPDLREKLVSKFNLGEKENVVTNHYCNSFFDDIIDNQKWVCPIDVKHSDSAYYSPSKDIICLPEKKQFKNHMSFYATAAHEMAHSTGIESRLNRENFSSRSKEHYAKEELYAELSAAIFCNLTGVHSTPQDNNAKYLKNWMEVINKEPEFILQCVNEASCIVKYMIDKTGLKIGQDLNLDGLQNNQPKEQVKKEGLLNKSKKAKFKIK